MAGTSKTVRQRVRVPLVPTQTNRIPNIGAIAESQNLDAYFYNAVAEITENQFTKEQITYAVKRPSVQAVSDWSTTFSSAPTTGQYSQGLWVFDNNLYFVYNNILYSVSNPAGYSLSSPTELYTFKAKDVFDSTGETLWNAFGNAFAQDYNYSGLEVFNNGLRVLYITNGFEDIIINRDGSVTEIPIAYNQWTANTFLKPGDKIIPTAYANQNYWYMVIGEAGITVETGASEPTWPTSIGAEVTDGDVTFICMSAIDNEVVAQEYTNRVYALNDLVVPSTESGYFYKCTTAGTASAEPGSWTQIKGDTSTATGGVIFECIGTYGGKPGLAIPSVVYLDTFIILAAYATSDIYHSDPSDLSSWGALNFISADSFTSPIKAITRYNNYILVFSETDGELFYNNANAEGSTLSRHESFLLQVGCFSQKMLVSTETICIWVASSQNGGKSIWILDGFEPKEISNTWANKMIENWFPGPYYSAYSIRIGGHFLVIFVSLFSALVFDVNLNLWYHWGVSEDSTGDTQLKWLWHYGAVQQNYKVNYLMSRTSYEVYRLDTSEYQDLWSASGTDTTDSIISGETTYVPIVTQIRTSLIDFGNNNRKFGHSLDIIASRNNQDYLNEPDLDNLINIYWSDNDYLNFEPSQILTYPENLPSHSVDAILRPRIAPIGNFRRRAFWIEHTTALPIRLEALEITYTQGSQ